MKQGLILFRSALVVIVFASMALWGCSSQKPAVKAETQVKEGYSRASEFYQKEEYEKAAAELEPLLFSSRATALEDDVLFLLADSYFHSEQYLLSSDMYDRLLQQVPRSPFREQAGFMLAQSYEKLSPVYELDQEYTRKAIESYSLWLGEYGTRDSAAVSRDLDTYRELLKINPDNASYRERFEGFSREMKRQGSITHATKAIPVLYDKLAASAYSVARQYVVLKKYKAAGIAFDEVVSRYSQTPWYRKALVGRIEVLVKRGKWFEARTAMDQFLQKYPESLEEMKGLREEILRNFSNS
ncbi:outer membrane protein assembly factor BamD [Chlorobium phaeovibrioides]|uniref:Outer membrane protein assembly factor BamD n=1 Tax=Chlorobium phaeovibrioides TaxID=1094 RepID=A0A5M8ICY4_CHLPH|nr:outer membrane protein assembly factor BamD [Chlorobium phaeovibrioides]KAA6233266.1 outer membrane protein assembly factor BamD [Chlorobium phaeovibrioides]